MESIESAIRYPMNRDDWITTIGIGGILTFLSFLLIPILFVYGLAVKAMRSTMEGDDVPPTFDDWEDLLIEGLKAGVIGLVYTIIPFLLFWLIVGSALASAIFGGDGGIAAAISGVFVGFLVTAIVGLVFAYVASIGIVNFAREGTIGAGFDFDVIRQVATDGDYVIAFLIVIGISIGIGIVTSIPLIGWLIAPFLGFYGTLVYARLLSTGFQDALAA